MDTGEQKNIVRNFLRQHTLGVVATYNDRDKKPEAAVLEFSETDELEIIFDTFSTHRKYSNLQTDRHVAFVIGWDEDTTVQYEGIAHELSGDELRRCQEIHLQKLPKAAKFVDREVIRYFKVTPNWIRYSNLSKDPWEVFEIRFDR